MKRNYYIEEIVEPVTSGHHPVMLIGWQEHGEQIEIRGSLKDLTTIALGVIPALNEIDFEKFLLTP
jgi:hypothetical protein